MRTGMLSRNTLAVCAAALCTYAQQADRIVVNSRAAEIEAQREEKARNLQPETPSKIEHILQVVKEKKVLERITAGTAGFRVHLGGLTTGSGFAAGPEYFRRFAHDDLIVRSSVRGSLRKFYLVDARAVLPRLAADHAFVDLYAAHRNYPHIDYYGPGPSSRKSGRTGFMLEDTSFEARTGVKPFAPLKLGVVGRYLLVNVGPGRDDRFASTDTVYTETTTPGIRRQSNYLQGGPFVQFDYRDNPGGPRRGGNYIAQFSTFSDRDLQRGSFSRVINGSGCGPR